MFDILVAFHLIFVHGVGVACPLRGLVDHGENTRRPDLLQRPLWTGREIDVSADETIMSGRYGTAIA